MERTQRISDNEKVRWLVITDANKKILQTKTNSRPDDKSKPNELAVSIVEIAKKARSAVRELDATVSPFLNMFNRTTLRFCASDLPTANS